MQLDFNLKFEIMKFGQKTFKQVTHGSKSTSLSLCIKDFHEFIPIVKNLQMN
jgi:hypothetical protein